MPLRRELWKVPTTLEMHKVGNFSCHPYD